MQETNIDDTLQRYEQALQEIRQINQQLLIAGLREQELADAAQEAQQAVILREQEKAVLEERSRIAEDFHDTLAQHLTGIKLQLELAEHLFTSDPQEAHGHLQRALDFAKRSIGEVRQCIRGLYPQELIQSDLPAALAQLVQRAERGSASVRLVVEGEPYELSPAIASNLFRICQESLTNALQHAYASKITVTFMYMPAQVRLRTQDDGAGFDMQKAYEGFGMRGLRQRALRLGGELTIQHGSGGGTEVSVTVDLPKES